MTLDLQALWNEAWSEQVADRRESSPSYEEGDYIVTGRAAARFGGKRNRDWWMDNGPVMAQRWLDWRLDTRWTLWETPEGNPGIEIGLTVNLPGDIPVKMYLDRVFVLPSGELAVVDLKSGRTPETPEQLGLYAVGMELQWGSAYRPRWGYWWDANKGTHSQPLNLDSFTADYFASMYTSAVAGISAGAFLPRPDNGCGKAGDGWCSVARYCHATKGPDAKGVDPLAG